MVEGNNGYLTLHEAAQILQVSDAFLYKKVQKNLMPHRRLGNRLIRFKRSDLDEYMDAQKKGKTGDDKSGSKRIQKRV